MADHNPDAGDKPQEVNDTKEENDDYDYNSDELENKEKFRNGVRPVATTSADTLESQLSPKLNSFAAVAQESLQCDSGDYTIPQDLDAIRNSAVAARYRRTGGIYEEYPYSDPRELDGVVVRRNEVASVEDENPYDNPIELVKAKNAEGTGPYDDPVELCVLGPNGVGRDGPYDDPTALDMPGAATASGKNGPYDAPTELGLHRTTNGEGPYDDPNEQNTMKKLSTMVLINRSKK